MSARGEFVLWIRRSPEHLHAYLQFLSLETEMTELDPSRTIDLSALLSQSSGNVVQLHTDESLAWPRPMFTRRRLYAGSALALIGCVIMCLLLVAFFGRKVKPVDYVTAVGEQRRIVLPDGSIVELNTQTHIRVAYSRNSRDVELASGEAVFSVEHKREQPFRVRTGRNVVEDVGTQFSIYARPDNTTLVSVLDGRVHLLASKPPTQGPSHSGDIQQTVELQRPLELLVGQSVRVDAYGRVVARSVVNLSEAAAWRQHRMWFENATLQEIATEFNRYNMRQVHVVQDRNVSKKRYNATWDPYDLPSFLDYLQNDPTLSVRATGETVLVTGSGDPR